MRGLGQNITRGGGVEAGGECQEYRDEIRQFGAIEIESGCDILFYQVNHRLAAFAAIAMDVLEQVQRKGAGTVEKLAVLRLKVQKFAAFDPGKQRLQPFDRGGGQNRSEEQTSELQSLMRNSYAAFCLKKKHMTRYNTTYQY